MIVITKNTTKNIYFTGTEKSTITNPYFLFVFTHRITNEIIKFVITNESNTKRYDVYELNVNDYFENSESGFWKYEIYEQDNDSNLDIDGLHLVENGFMYLNDETSFERIKYNKQSNEFLTYNG